jgi:DNA-binding response OmpR family regulator
MQAIFALRMIGMSSVLVVEDDPKIGRLVVKALTGEGYEVAWCKTGLAAREQVESGKHALIVLDWMLPEVDGITLCKAFRASGVQAPILMLTAKGEVKDRVEGLEAGADDYVPKPFEIDELLARVKALLRRAGNTGKITCGALEVDRLNHRALLRDNKRETTLSLTSREFSLLVFLAAHVEHAVSRAEVLSDVWGPSFDINSNLVEVHVSRLREKFGELAWMIETVRGVGYRLRSAPHVA